MGIESLNKAVEAAGYAMATPDDEPMADVPRAEPQLAGRALVLMAPKSAEASKTVDALQSAAGWLRGHLPAFGGRAPA